MRASEAGAAAGVTVKALRHYEVSGLLQPGRLLNGYRDYSFDDIRLVSEIRSLMALGLALKETQPFVECLREGHEAADDCPESLLVYRDKIEQLDTLITRLQRNRARLADQMRVAAERGFRSFDPSMEVPPMLPQPDPLPKDLPTPIDDGAARDLPGRVLPALELPATDGSKVRLNSVATGRWVLFIYPLTGRPGVDMPSGWDQIPGARGCSQEACSFRDHLGALQAQGAQQVLALSTDGTQYQQDLTRRFHLPYRMLSDPALSLARALDLPTFDANGMTLYKRLTMIVRGNQIEHVFYPIFPPDAHASEVLEWLRANPDH
jgi:peroxiredoxin/DNA-binding transcriptional MerR regulator